VTARHTITLSQRWVAVNVILHISSTEEQRCCYLAEGVRGLLAVLGAGGALAVGLDDLLQLRQQQHRQVARRALYARKGNVTNWRRAAIHSRDRSHVLRCRQLTTTDTHKAQKPRRCRSTTSTGALHRAANHLNSALLGLRGHSLAHPKSLSAKPSYMDCNTTHTQYAPLL
jgi:hypothetical protein